MDKLDIENIETIEQLNSIDWEKYSDSSYQDPNYHRVKHIVYPVSCDALDKICELSRMKDSKVKLCWDMGELFILREVK